MPGNHPLIVQLYQLAFEAARYYFDVDSPTPEQLPKALGMLLSEWSDYTDLILLAIASTALEDANFHLMAAIIEEFMDMTEDEIERRWNRLSVPWISAFQRPLPSNLATFRN